MDSGWGCNNRDGATLATLESTHEEIEQDYIKRLRTQLAGINLEKGTNVTTLVPVWNAVMTLRESEFSAIYISVTPLVW